MELCVSQNAYENQGIFAYATAIVNINQDKKQYVTSDVKEMDKTRLLKLVGENEQKTAKHVMHGQAELARRIGIPQQTIGLYLKLLDLSPKVQKKIKDLGVAMGEELAKIKDEKLQLKVA